MLRLMRGPTGHDERLVPEVADPGNLAQHVRRYQFALPYCVGKTVLDVATGVGYGADMIAESARRVYAVDYDAPSVRYAGRRYGLDRVAFLVGDVLALPLRAGDVQVVTAFEIIEHVSDHHQLLSEICRVLTPDGCLIISTPNTRTASLFRRKAGFTYDAHVSEVDLATFRAELREKFTEVRILGMRLRGTYLYSLLRSLDPWHLRLRLVPSSQIHFLRERVFHVPSKVVSANDVVVSRWQLRQANHFLAVCQKKRT